MGFFILLIDNNFFFSYIYDVMKTVIGIRREDKNRWERRVPLIPEHVAALRREHNVEVIIQPSEIRIFSNDEYRRAGASVSEDLSPCPIVFAVKEIPIHFFEPGKTYVFFSHVIKGQPHNMPMLRQMLDLKCQLIDYEKVEDGKGRRLIFFGRQAGLAGMIDSLWALGQRLNYECIENPFSGIRLAHQYESLAEANEEIVSAGEKICTQGLPESLSPLICGFAGYGHVSQGAQEILSLLPVQEIDPGEVESVLRGQDYSKNLIYKTVFKEEHLVQPISPGVRFELQDYYDHPEKYRSQFESYLSNLTLLINCIYWDERYPRLVTKGYLKQLYAGGGSPRLRVIGDISCDVEGAVECTVRCTNPGSPIFVYDPFEERAADGWEGIGPVVLAVDNLPCELPRESSTYFSGVLKQFVPPMVKADFSGDFDQCKLPSAIKNAVIVYHGELISDYRYLKKFL